MVYPKVIERHILQELPFMATENIIMEGVKKGGDRQELHEHIRVHSMEAGKQVKEEGAENDLLDRIAADPVFRLSRADIGAILNVADFVGRAPQQTVEFITDIIDPLIRRGKAFGPIDKIEIKV